MYSWFWILYEYFIWLFLSRIAFPYNMTISFSSTECSSRGREKNNKLHIKIVYWFLLSTQHTGSGYCKFLYRLPYARQHHHQHLYSCLPKNRVRGASSFLNRFRWTPLAYGRCGYTCKQVTHSFNTCIATYNDVKKRFIVYKL